MTAGGGLWVNATVRGGAPSCRRTWSQLSVGLLISFENARSMEVISWRHGRRGVGCTWGIRAMALAMRLLSMCKCTKAMDEAVV